MKKVICMISAAVVLLSGGGVLYAAAQSNSAQIPVGEAGTIYYGHSANGDHSHQSKADRVVTTMNLQPTVKVSYDKMICDVSGCTLTYDHSHGICNVSGCINETNHEHNGMIHYGHSSDDGHSYHNNSGHESGHSNRHGNRHNNRHGNGHE